MVVPDDGLADIEGDGALSCPHEVRFDAAFTVEGPLAQEARLPKPEVIKTMEWSVTGSTRQGGRAKDVRRPKYVHDSQGVAGQIFRATLTERMLEVIQDVHGGSQL